SDVAARPWIPAFAGMSGASGATVYFVRSPGVERHRSGSTAAKHTAGSMGLRGIGDMSLRNKTFRTQLGRVPNLTTGVVATALAIGCVAADPARAQTAPRAAATTFAIPAQSLPGAIDAFIRATGWQVGYSSAAATNAGSPGVSGAMAPAAALRRLLA